MERAKKPGLLDSVSVVSNPCSFHRALQRCSRAEGSYRFSCGLLLAEAEEEAAFTGPACGLAAIVPHTCRSIDGSNQGDVPAGDQYRPSRAETFEGQKLRILPNQSTLNALLMSNSNADSEAFADPVLQHPHTRKTRIEGRGLHKIQNTRRGSMLQFSKD